MKCAEAFSISLHFYRSFTKYTITANIKQVAAETIYCIMKKSLFISAILSGRCFSICFANCALFPRKTASPQPISPHISDPAISNGHSGAKNPSMIPTITCSIGCISFLVFYIYYTVVSAVIKRKNTKIEGDVIYDRRASLSSATNDGVVHNGAYSKNVGAVAQSAANKSTSPFVTSNVAEKTSESKSKIFGEFNESDIDELIKSAGFTPIDSENEVLVAPDNISNTAEERERLEGA